MNQQTPEQGRQQLQEIIGGIFDHVLRKEKENALLSAGRMEAKDCTSAYQAQIGKGWEERKIEQ